MKVLLLIASLLIFPMLSYAQNAKPELDNGVNVLFGLSQVAIDGFNVEGNLFLNRLAFDYSHGVSLSLTNDRLEDGADKDQNLDVFIPWTTGFGVGYRFNNWLNLRVEPKLHKFELYAAGADRNAANLLGDYTTFTLGLGAYANLRPFKNSDNFLRGIMISPSIRWWPNVSNSLDDDQLSYLNPATEQRVTHEARNIGFGNTAFFANVSLGYSVKF